MTKQQARAALIDAVQTVARTPNSMIVWEAQWLRMLHVQRSYRGPLSLEPLLMAKPITAADLANFRT
jgi:hypothetical protein